MDNGRYRKNREWLESLASLRFQYRNEGEIDWKDADTKLLISDLKLARPSSSKWRQFHYAIKRMRMGEIYKNKNTKQSWRIVTKFCADCGVPTSRFSLCKFPSCMWRQ